MFLLPPPSLYIRYALKRLELKSTANPLLGIKAGTDAAGGAGAGGGGGKGKGKGKGGKGGGKGGAGGGGQEEAPWRLGPNGCVVEAVDG